MRGARRLLDVDRLLLAVDDPGLLVGARPIVDLRVLVRDLDAAGVLGLDFERLLVGRDGRRLAVGGDLRRRAQRQRACDRGDRRAEDDADRDQPLARATPLERLEILIRTGVSGLRVRGAGIRGAVAAGDVKVVPVAAAVRLRVDEQRVAVGRRRTSGLLLAGDEGPERVVLPDDPGELGQGIVLCRLRRKLRLLQLPLDVVEVQDEALVRLSH